MYKLNSAQFVLAFDLVRRCFFLIILFVQAADNINCCIIC